MRPAVASALFEAGMPFARERRAYAIRPYTSR